MIAAIAHYIFPCRQIISSQRMIATGDHQFAVAHKGWFAKYRDVDIVKITVEGMMKLENTGGWAYFEDAGLELALRERMAADHLAAAKRKAA